MNNLFEIIAILFLLQIICSSGQRLAGKKFYSTSRCLTPNNKIGKCINIRECKELLTLLEFKSKDPTTVQFLRNSQCGMVGMDPKVCCSTGTTYNPTTIRTDLPDTRVCGEPEITNKIIGGQGTKLGDYPWIAALGYRKSNNPGPEWICGGSLISSKYVLTASHCLFGISPWELFVVRLGDLNLNESVDDGATPLDVLVDYHVLHEKYTSSPVTNDIALIKLRTPVKFSSYIKPICLPLAYELRSNGLENQFGYVAGWGRTSTTNTASYSSLLLDVKLPILDVNVCKQAYKTIPKSYVDNKNLCAGFLQGRKDSCQGDSGGPLMWENPVDSKYYLVGIVSYGYKCAEPGYPGVYTRVSEYIDWIKINAI